MTAKSDSSSGPTGCRRRSEKNLASLSRASNDSRQTMIRADMALYEAKAAGRNRISVASEEPD